VHISDGKSAPASSAAAEDSDPSAAEDDDAAAEDEAAAAEDDNAATDEAAACEIPLAEDDEAAVEEAAAEDDAEAAEAAAVEPVPPVAQEPGGEVELSGLGSCPSSCGAKSGGGLCKETLAATCCAIDPRRLRRCCRGVAGGLGLEGGCCGATGF